MLFTGWTPLPSLSNPFFKSYIRLGGSLSQEVGKTISVPIASSGLVGKTISVQLASIGLVGKTILVQLASTGLVGKTIPVQLASTVLVGNTISIQLATTGLGRTKREAGKRLIFRKNGKQAG